MSASYLENPIVTLVIGAALGITGSVLSQIITGIQAHREAKYEFFREKAQTVSAYLSTVTVLIGSIRRLLEEQKAKESGTEHLLAPVFSNETSIDRFNRIREAHVNQHFKLVSDGFLLLLPEKVKDDIEKIGELTVRMGLLVKEAGNDKIDANKLGQLEQEFSKYRKDVVKELRKGLGID